MKGVEVIFELLHRLVRAAGEADIDWVLHSPSLRED